MHRFASVVLVDRRGRLLLQERDEHPVIDPEKWGFPGGRVEAGEDYETAAHRELEEETGVRVDRLELFGEFEVFHEHSASTDRFGLFAASVDLGEGEVECHEGRQMVFVDPGVARGLDLTAAARIALPAFLDSDLYRRMAS